MAFTVGAQLFLFLASLAFSVIIGVEYDIFRVTRLIFHFGVWAVFIEDLIFFILCSVEFFLFCFIFNNGEIRLYIIFSCCAGCLIYYLTVGKFIYLKMKRLILNIKKRRGGKAESALPDKNREK